MDVIYRRQRGRPQRVEPKARPMWIGQVASGDYLYIMTRLTPRERCAVLMRAAAEKERTEATSEPN